MDRDNRYISIKEIASRVLRHPLLLGVDLETVTLYTVDFLHIAGTPDMFQDKEVILHTEDYRAKLPCDLLYVIQVMDLHCNKCLRSTTDSFESHLKNPKEHCGCHRPVDREELTYKVQNSVIFTSMKEEDIKVAYKAIYVDEEGYPMIIDNSNFLKALEAYIKLEVFTILFDCGTINLHVLENAKQEYCWYVGKAIADFQSPSYGEMESIRRDWTALLPRTNQFESGFKHLGNQEYLRTH